MPDNLFEHSIVFAMGSVLCNMLKKLPWISPCESRISIKLITVDGKVMRFKCPVYVKEIVEEYPHHGIFDVGSMETDVQMRPLDHNSELQSGQLYYLIPVSSVGSRLGELEHIYSHPAIISTSSIDAGSHGLRVKLVLKNKDVASFLSSTNINFGEKERSILAMGQLPFKLGPGFTSEWKPNLDTIDTIMEINRPCCD